MHVLTHIVSGYDVNAEPFNSSIRIIDILIYLLTTIGLSPGGSSTVHIYTQTVHRTTQTDNTKNNTTIWKSASRAPSWLVIPWHLPYN